jgi:phage protein D
MIKDGYSSIYVRVYYGKVELSPNITKFRYVYDEENDDEIELTVEVNDIAEVDKPYYQDDAQLTLIWGYIGEQTSARRKVWVREPKWSFGKDNNIVGTLKCTEKGTETKGASSKRVFKNKSLPEIAQEIADKHGLNAYLETYKGEKVEVKITPQPGESLDKFLVRENLEKANAKTQAQQNYFKKHPDEEKIFMKDLFAQIQKQNQDPAVKARRKAENQYLDAWEAGATPTPIDSLPGALRPNFNFQIWDNVPQANKSDKQLLNDLGQREKDGPYIVKTRDDELIIKKRDFTKPPYKTYTWAGGSGELLSFDADHKKRGRRGKSTNMAFSGWNPLDKTTFAGTTNAADGSPALAKALEMLKFYKDVQGRGGGKLITGERVSKEFLPFIGPNNVQAKIDNAGIFTRSMLKVSVTVDDKVSALDKAINNYTTKKDAKRKEMYNSLGINPVDAFHQAGNSRRESELKKHQIMATIIGDPNIKDGMIISITGLSKKYNGNWYITRATHDLQKGSAYMVDVELMRQGHNIKVSGDYADHRDLGRDVNKQTGPDDTPEITKVLPKKSNPKPKPPEYFIEAEIGSFLNFFK